MITIDTETVPETTTGKKDARVRHYVELGPDNKYLDKALCGELWDQLHVPHNGAICQECIEVMRKRGHA